MLTPWRILLGAVVALGVVVAATLGARAAVVYAFLAAIPVGLAYAASVGGDWVRDTSRGRFDDDDARR